MTRRKLKKLETAGKIQRQKLLLRIQKLLDRGWIASTEDIPPGCVPVDPDLIRYGWSYDGPLYYIDRPFTCRDCGVLEIWKAEDQQWYYEVVQASVHHTAVRCRSCRHSERERKAEARTRAGHQASQRTITNPNSEHPSP